MSKRQAALKAFNRAAETLSGNPYLAGYLLGMADAWYIVGIIDPATRKGMQAIARSKRVEGKG